MQQAQQQVKAKVNHSNKKNAQKKERAITTDTHHHHLKELHDSQKHKQKPKQNKIPKNPQMQKPPKKASCSIFKAPKYPRAQTPAL
jgi:hypothetical protein